MNAMGYDAGNIGNHEFNYGSTSCARPSRRPASPYVNSNVGGDDRRRQRGQLDNAFTPYVILEREFRDEAARRTG